eukprot:gene15571-biopygen5425
MSQPMHDAGGGAESEATWRDDFLLSSQNRAEHHQHPGQPYKLGHLQPPRFTMTGRAGAAAGP